MVGLAPIYNQIEHYNLSALQLFWVYVILALPYAYRALAIRAGRDRRDDHVGGRAQPRALTGSP